MTRDERQKAHRPLLDPFKILLEISCSIRKATVPVQSHKTNMVESSMFALHRKLLISKHVFSRVED